MKEIVIKIDDEVYLNLFTIKPMDLADQIAIDTAIRNGKVLPKGHKRLIEDKVDAWLELEYNGCEIKKVEDWHNIPTIIEADKGE